MKKLAVALLASLAFFVGGCNEEKVIERAVYSGQFRSCDGITWMVQTDCTASGCDTMLTDLSTGNFYHPRPCANDSSEKIILGGIYVCYRAQNFMADHCFIGQAPQNYKATIQMAEKEIMEGKYTLDATKAASVDLQMQKNGKIVLIQEGGNARSIRLERGKREAGSEFVQGKQIRIVDPKVQIEVRGSELALDRVLQ
jgi:hypothetical protein